MTERERKEESKEKVFEIRIVLRPDSKKDRITYERFKEMMNYHHPIDPSPLGKMLFNKAYEKWFIHDIKEKANVKK